MFFSIRYPDGMGHNTEAASLFQAAANALRWCEISCQTFGTAKRFRDDEVLMISVGMTGEKGRHRVRIGRVRKWLSESAGMLAKARLDA